MNILAFAGSLRRKSFNKSLLKAAVQQSPEGMNIEIFDLAGIPLFDADLEAEGDPERVREFKEAIQKSDGLLIASPDYNHGMTAVTKNAIDWASRPAKDKPISGKPVGILGASPGRTGTARSQDQLRISLKAVDAYCMTKPEFLLSRVHELINEEGELKDEKNVNFLKTYLNSFANWVNKFKS